MREIDPLSLIFINFDIPALTPGLHVHEPNEFSHLYSQGTDKHHRKHMSRDQPPLCDVTADTENSLLYCYVLDSVYRAVAWQRVDQNSYNTMINEK
jgi:hypothetical protein